MFRSGVGLVAFGINQKTKKVQRYPRVIVKKYSGNFNMGFFLEKNMVSYFLHIMRQKSGGSSFVGVRLLQTLNILFENILTVSINFEVSKHCRGM
uniref:Uncharacterized protein n=1 Tax=Glossina palpalis gambiensis TaxID=67801 RepID=A0A1B0APX8_9MUSC